MGNALNIAGRELRAYFFGPAGYIIMALFALIAGLWFVSSSLVQGAAATMRPLFSIGTWMLAFVAPAITMRLFAEEYRLGTFEALMSCPVREAEVVAGKFLGAMGLLAAVLAPTAIHVIALEAHGRPDYGEILCGYLGLALAGCLYISSGMLASTLTSSQPVAFLVSLFFWLAVGLGAGLLPSRLGERGAALVYAADPQRRLADFTIGLIDTSNVVYFLSLTAFFLLATSGVLRARRFA
jgi:ABC-2 type transport system permease protein